MPDRSTPNPDSGSIPGFVSYEWQNNKGDTGKVLEDSGDPVSIHLHRHKDGLTISKYVGDDAVERYNFNTGEQEKG